MRTVSQWAFRLKKESEVSKTSFFVTLTYDTDHVPLTKKGYMTLDKKDFQDFMKRLRRYDNDNKNIKYFAVGEYGSKNERPHYHLILFNASKDAIFKAWKLDGKFIGQIHVGAVSGASVTYTLKYMMKEGKIPKHQNDDRIPEFRLMSKKLGVKYLSNEVKDFHRRRPDKKFITIEDGIKVPMPRYYAEKIWTEQELKEIGEKLKTLNQQKNEEAERQFRKQYPDRDWTKREYEAAEYRNRKIKQSQDKRNL